MRNDVGRDVPGWLRELGITGAGAGNALAEAYCRAVDRLELPIVDLLTIRDLVEISGCRQTPLQTVLLALFDARNRGSLCLPLDEKSLGQALRELSDCPDDMAARFRKGLAAGHYDPLVGKTATDGKPAVVQGESRYLYLQKYLRHELQLKAELAQLLARRQPVVREPVQHIRSIVEEVITTGAYPLNREQIRALYVALLSNFAIISGGPGTGKTSVVVSLLRCLHRCGIRSDRVRLIAPTGRAAQRLGESVLAGLRDCTDADTVKDGLAEIRGTTIHRLLRYNPSRNEFTHHRNNPLPVDAVVVDEVSMVDVVLMARLLEALPTDALLVFLGDRHQLPSVEAGAVLGDLVPIDRKPAFSPAMADLLQRVGDHVTGEPGDAEEALVDRVVVLSESYRSRPGISRVASRVNAGDTNLLEDLPVLSPDRRALHARTGAAPVDWLVPEDCVRIDPTGVRADGYRRILASWLDCVGDRGTYAELAGQTLPLTPNDERTVAAGAALWLEALFRALRGSQILTLIRGGIHGCSGVNRYLGERWAASRGDRKGASPLAPGTPVMITRNDHRRELYNGDVGIVLATADGRLRVVFRRFGCFEAFPVDLLPPHELAFAITVHKSQGTEYDNVLLILPPDPAHRLLTREVVYTGLTRARERCFVYASAAALTHAIEHRIERTSGLDLWST